MPLAKQESIAITRAELQQIRNQLAAAFQHHLLERDGQRILFLRSPRDEPDPVTDLEQCLEHLPDPAVRELSHVILLGTRSDLHLAATTIRPLLDRRRLLDTMAATHWRTTLAPTYGVGLHWVAGDPANLTRLGLRIPRRRCVDLTDTDLLQLATILGPSIDDGTTSMAAIAYIVSDEDHVRLPAEELLADLAPRWQHIKTTPPPAPVRVPEPAPAPDPVLEAPAPPPRRKPSRSIRVRPALELELHVDATPPEIDFDPIQLQHATTTLEKRLRDANFDVMTNVAHDAHTFALAAERTHGYPRRVLVRCLAQFRKTEAAESLHLARDLDADLLIVLAPHIDDDAARRTVATKVKVLSPAHLDQLRL